MNEQAQRVEIAHLQHLALLAEAGQVNAHDACGEIAARLPGLLPRTPQIERHALFDYFSGCAASGIDVAGGEESKRLEAEHATMTARLRIALGISPASRPEKPRWQTFTVSRSEGTELGLGSYEGADRKFELVYWQKFLTAAEAHPIAVRMEALCAALNAGGVVV